MSLIDRLFGSSKERAQSPHDKSRSVETPEKDPRGSSNRSYFDEADLDSCPRCGEAAQMAYITGPREPSDDDEVVEGLKNFSGAGSVCVIEDGSRYYHVDDYIEAGQEVQEE